MDEGKLRDADNLLARALQARDRGDDALADQLTALALQLFDQAGALLPPPMPPLAQPIMPQQQQQQQQQRNRIKPKESGQE
jgi:hypothetical protein